MTNSNVTVLQNHHTVFQFLGCFAFQIPCILRHQKPLTALTTPYSSSIWFPSSRAQTDLFESLQYHAAKITIRTKMNIPKCVLFAKLGWEPINTFLDRQRVFVFFRFSKISNNRLSKAVFMNCSDLKHKILNGLTFHIFVHCLQM